jgi:hypothetical protein
MRYFHLQTFIILQDSVQFIVNSWLNYIFHVTSQYKTHSIIKLLKIFSHFKDYCLPKYPNELLNNI